jgi:hypothetical protein
VETCLPQAGGNPELQKIWIPAGVYPVAEQDRMTKRTNSAILKGLKNIFNRIQ